MRHMPAMIEGRKTTLMTSSFHGYNRKDIIADGEMHDMQNMSGDSYPLLTLRAKRGISSYDVSGQDPVPLTGIHGRDQLVFVRGTQVYYNFTPVSGLTVSAAEGMTPKKIVSMGAYVCIWPDMVYFNTADLSDYGSMNRMYGADGTDISLIMCRGDGTNYDMTNIERGPNPPSNPTNAMLWLDESGENDVLRQYMEATEEWLEVATTYVKISATGIGSGLKEYDCVTISGLAAAGSGGADPDPRIANQVAALNGSMIVYFRGEDYIVVAGLLSQAQDALAAGDVRADLEVPAMDFVCESNNRLWGCKYGLVDGQAVNEIYASKLGDFRNWRNYMGLSTDSYTASVGTDGPFTGAITQRGYPVFFKENCIHKITGQTPSTFSIQTTIARGVQKDSWRSLAVVNEAIYYKSRGEVMMYDGNLPQSVSEQLGEILYYNARAGVLGEKYYISMMDRDENWVLMNYDTANGVWYKEDNAKALGFGAVDDELFFIDEVNNTLVSVTGSVGTKETALDWMAEFDLYGVNYRSASAYDDPARVRNEKYVSMFKIRMELDNNAWVKLYMKYNDGQYEFLGERRGTDILKTHILPVKPRRCDHVRYKLEGHGGAKIYDISRIMEVGGDG